MDKRTERFNEITFEAFAKTAIDNAIINARKEQARRAKVEITFSELPEKLLLSLATSPMKDTEDAPAMFQVKGYEVDVHDPCLGQALRFLTPRDREIILLSYFLDMKDREIAEILDISRSAVQRHRVSAQEKLKVLLGNPHE